MSTKAPLQGPSVILFLNGRESRLPARWGEPRATQRGPNQKNDLQNVVVNIDVLLVTQESMDKMGRSHIGQSSDPMAKKSAQCK